MHHRGATRTCVREDQDPNQKVNAREHLEFFGSGHTRLRSPATPPISEKQTITSTHFSNAVVPPDSTAVLLLPPA